MLKTAGRCPQHIFTARIRRMWEGNVFTGVCPFTGGDPRPRFFARSFLGDTPVPPSWPWGTPSLAGGIPVLVEGRYPPPLARAGWGTPPPPPPGTEQQSKYLLHGGWYASCDNAGRLSFPS